MENETGHTIEMYFDEETEYNSLLTVTLDNWDGWAYRIARGDVKKFRKRCKEVSKSYGQNQNAYVDDGKNYNGYGIYLYFFDGDEGDYVGKKCVYVGESETVLERLYQHINAFERGKKKNEEVNEHEWEYAIAFISPSLSKTGIKYVEDQLRSTLEQNKEFVCVTGASSSRIPKKSTVSSANRFIENIKRVMPYLNDKVFKQESNKNVTTTSTDIHSFTLARKDGCVSATGYISKKGFTVKADSQAKKNPAKSLQKSYCALRLLLLSQGIFDNNFKLTEDYEFSSSSTAASVMYGSNQNGYIKWIDENNVTLENYLEMESSKEDDDEDSEIKT